MSATTRRRGPSLPLPTLALAAGLGMFTFALVSAWLGAHAGAWLAGEPPPGSPPTMVVRLVAGTYHWPGPLATVFATLPALAALTLLWVLRRRLRRRPLVDRSARYLAAPRQVRRLTTAGASSAAARLGVPPTAPPGVFIGRHVGRGGDLWGSWEDMHLDIWGPRTGKTVARAIPNIVSAPGFVVVTSNKRDVVDATRGVRERKGPVWVFDPQNQAGERPTWWWDPLSFVGSSIESGYMLASFFAGVNRPAHARSDGYFEPAAQDLFGTLLLAASLEGLPITQVFTWLTRPTDDTPVRVLRAAGRDASADYVEAIITAPSRQRSGVYGTAVQMASFLIAPGVNEWITPGSNPRRPCFDHKRFGAHDNGTIYLLSEETNKMAAPLVLTLTTGIAYAAEARAISSPGGRLPTPALFVLDEAANVCPWEELPLLYTHYGSRGIVVMTILQSWAQGAAVWGDIGMAKMWGAANVRVYGGGVSDMAFLRDLSATTGRFEPTTYSLSGPVRSLFDRTVTLETRPEPVLDESDLASLPRGRAFVQVSGLPPVLVQTVPWWQTRHSTAIRASLARYEPR